MRGRRCLQQICWYIQGVSRNQILRFQVSTQVAPVVSTQVPTAVPTQVPPHSAGTFFTFSIDNANKKTPTSDHVSTLAAPLPPKPPCNRMCPLEQRASGPSQPEWTPEVADDSAASMSPKTTKTPHSDTKTAPALMTVDNDVTLRRCVPRRPELSPHLDDNDDERSFAPFDDFYDADV